MCGFFFSVIREVHVDFIAMSRRVESKGPRPQMKDLDGVSEKKVLIYRVVPFNY